MSVVLTRYQQKPRIGVQINWAHSLAQGISMCFLLNGKSSIAAQSIELSITGSPIFTSNGLKSDTNNSGLFLSSGIPTSILPTRSFSIAWIGMTLAGATGNTTYFAVTPNSTNTSPFVSCGISPSGGANKYLLQFNDGTSYQAVTSSASHAIGARAHIVGTVMTGDQKLYINGRQDATTGSVAISSDIAFTSPAIGIGEYGGATGNANCITYMAVLWRNRVLTKGEIEWLYVDPYAFIQPLAIRRHYFLQSTPSTYGGYLSPTGWF